MPSADDIRKQIEALKSEEATLTSKSKVLRKKKVDNNKVRIQCSGSGGIPCPDEAFEFFKVKSAFKWVCRKCLLRRDNYILVCDSKGYTREWLEREKFLYRHTLYTVKSKSGRDIPVGFTGKPLLKSDIEEFEVLKLTQDSLPKEYFWCIKYNEPWRRIKSECSDCTLNVKCDPYQLYKSNKEVRELQTKLNQLTVSDKVDTVKNTKKQLKEEALRVQREKERAILDSFKRPTKRMCTDCGDNFKSDDSSYWGFDGTRWVVQIPVKLESNCIKYLCNACKKDRG